MKTGLRHSKQLSKDIWSLLPYNILPRIHPFLPWQWSLGLNSSSVSRICLQMWRVPPPKPLAPGCPIQPLAHSICCREHQGTCWILKPKEGAEGKSMSWTKHTLLCPSLTCVNLPLCPLVLYLHYKRFDFLLCRLTMSNTSEISSTPAVLRCHHNKNDYNTGVCFKHCVLRQVASTNKRWI